MLHEEKPSLDELVHFGVKGMHWGVRSRTRSAYGEAKAKQHELAVASRPARVAARKVTEVVGDPRSAVTFATTIGLGVLLIKSPGARSMMKTSVTGVAKAANTKRGRKVTLQILKGAGHVYANR